MAHQLSRGVTAWHHALSLYFAAGSLLKAFLGLLLALCALDMRPHCCSAPPDFDAMLRPLT